MARRLLGQGSTLRELLHQAPRPLPAALVRGVARELLAALAEVHARGLCHLDVKPANVWVTGGPAATRACLLDLAFAHEFVPGAGWPGSAAQPQPVCEKGRQHVPAASSAIPGAGQRPELCPVVCQPLACCHDPQPDPCRCTWFCCHSS